MPPDITPPNDRATRIYRRLLRFRGMDDNERWQHALFFAMSPEQRCQLSIRLAKAAKASQRTSRRSAKRR
jgi:hypothetical protein